MSSEKQYHEQLEAPMEASVIQSAIGSGPNGVTYIPGGDAEKRLLRKIDMHLVPVVWGMYILSYLDRSSIGNAKTGGMEKDLKLTSTDYSIVLLIFFVGYVIGEIPSNMILTRVRPSLYLPSLMAVWGAISMCMAACNSWQTLTVTRFFLGLVEAGFAPGVLFMMSSWYRKNELARRFCLYYTASALSGALGGLLAGAITGHMKNAAGIAGWKWLFIIEGAATVVAALPGFYFLPNFPSTTKWLNDEEKWLAAARLAADDIGSAKGHGATEGHWASLKQCLGDWRTYVFTFIFMMVTGSQTIQYFIPTLTKLLNPDPVTAQYLTIPVYATAVVMILVIPSSSDIRKERGFHLAGSMALGAACFVVLIATQQRIVQYVFLCFGVGAIYASAPLALVWTSNVISWPAEKRAVTQAFVNACGNSASIYGAFLWPAKTAPKYTMGFSVTLAMLAACSIAAVCMKFLVIRYPYRIPGVDEETPSEVGQITPPYELEKNKGTSSHV